MDTPIVTSCITCDAPMTTEDRKASGYLHQCVICVVAVRSANARAGTIKRSKDAA